MFFDLQPLESRQLLSSSLSGIFQDPTIKADQQAVNAATKTLVTDQRAGRKTIAADQKAVRTEYQKLIADKGKDAVDTALQPLQTTLRADEKAKNKALRTAGQTLSTDLRQWNKTIFADTKVWRQDEKDGDTAGAAAAKTTLDNDKSAAKTAVQPDRDAIQAIKDKYRPIITADHDAITNEPRNTRPGPQAALRQARH